MLHLYLGSLLVIGAAGCGGGGGGFKVAPVSGVVTLNGVPLANAMVRFQPDATGNPGPPSIGETDDQGNFILTFSDGQEGAVVGPHKVYISTRKMQANAENSDIETEIAPELVPANYRTAPPTFDVPKGGTTSAKFELAGTATAGGDQGGQPTRVRND
jgi:hypothetical protein